MESSIQVTAMGWFEVMCEPASETSALLDTALAEYVSPFIRVTVKVSPAE
jgi:hypothetical protein